MTLENEGDMIVAGCLCKGGEGAVVTFISEVE